MIRKINKAQEEYLFKRFKEKGLTDKQASTAILVFIGYSNNKIADLTFLSLKGIKFRCTHIFLNLGIKKRTEIHSVFSSKELMKFYSLADSEIEEEKPVIEPIKKISVTEPVISLPIGNN